MDSRANGLARELAVVFLPRLALALGLSLAMAFACAAAWGATLEAPGADVFATPREAVIREKPSPEARIVGRLVQGGRAALVESRDRYLRVEAPGVAGGWIAREVVVVFSADPSATKDLVAIGRVFGRNEGNRRLAAALLARASERLRTANTPDPEVEVLLGETVEGLTAVSGATFPPELGLLVKTDATGTHASYGGAAFQRALDLLARDASPERMPLRERALAGLLRAQFPERSAAFPALLQETAGWLQLAETASDPGVLAASAERAGGAALALGRYLLALGRLDDLGRLRDRLGAAAARVKTALPGTRDGARLEARAAILQAMRGEGGPSFPQEAKVTLGPKERAVRIDGKLGALELRVETRVGATRDAQVRKGAVPILPVPGSLRVSPDGRSAAWVEVAGPSLLVPVTAPLDRDEPAREVAFLANGRPLRDRALAHVVSTLSGFSRDGQRLGLAIDAWNDAPGPSPRFSVVSVATGELLFETSKDVKSFQRLLQ